jgi:hypothetical protein
LKPSNTASNKNAAGGRAYILTEKPDVAMITAALHRDAGVAPVVEVIEGETDNWLHVLHRVKDGRDVFLICNQQHEGKAKDFQLKITTQGHPEIWDAMRNELTSVPVTRDGDKVTFPLTLEPMESVLVVCQPEKRDLPARLTQKLLSTSKVIPVGNNAWSGSSFHGKFELPGNLGSSRVFIEIEGPTTEPAARVKVNGIEAGGFIGKPYRLDITRHLKAGENKIKVIPFGPTSVKIRILNDQ